jgi:predicted small metal-binding protein
MPEPHVSKRINCGAIVPGCHLDRDCAQRRRAAQEVAAHALHAHGVTDVTPELVAQVKAAIKDA